jgi:hypothetical protein
MRVRHFHNALLVSAGALTLAACGGGGGTTTAFIPPPEVTPTPSSSAAATVTIFPSPSATTYVTVGGSMAIPGETKSSRFGTISTADADQPHIRYAAGGYYEIQLPSKDWEMLVPYKGLANPTTDNTSFQPASAAQNQAGFNTVTARWAGYVYSEYASWYSRESGRSGWLAFGIPTPASGVPTTGSASYLGSVHGTADIMQTDLLSRPSHYPAGVDGNVTLSFDFQRGTLGGGMDLFLQGTVDPIKISSFSFKDAVYSSGSTTYSGRFDTLLNGSNFFLGRFTGPNAQETIAAWAVPFVFNQGDSGIPADGQQHQAIGSWVAKQ